MPSPKTIQGQRLSIVSCGVENHFNNAVDISIGWRESADVDAESLGKGRSNLIDIQSLTFNLARLENVLNEEFKRRFSTRGEAERLHPTDQAALLVAHSGEGGCQPSILPSKLGPIWLLVDVHR